MKALKTKTKYILVASILSITSVFGIVDSVSSISPTCEKSEECRAAYEKEKEAKAKADAANAAADELQIEVNKLEADISSMATQISESEARAKELQEQIDQTEKKLLEQQSVLADLLVEIHFEDKTDPISILAGSSSLSDYAERQTRIETLRNQIKISADGVKEAKEKLEEDKASVEELIASQKVMKSEMARVSNERQQLVEKYQGDAAAFSEDAKAARAAQQAAIQAYMEAHRELFAPTTGSYGVYTGDNTYAWQADCPARQDSYTTAVDGYYIGGYVCECVSYAGWKAYEIYGLYLSWGNANTWDDVGRSKGIVDHTPAPQVIGQTDAGGYGHVFWVESVNSDGSINITEYNNAFSSASGSWGDFGGRVIPASQVGLYNYIHVDRL